MQFVQNFKDELFKITDNNFKIKTLEVFHYQYDQNKIYRKYADLIGCNPSKVNELVEIPFLPVSLFKYWPISTTMAKAEKYFISSGTSDNNIRSKHYIYDEKFYHNVCRQIFEQQFGSLNDCIVIALLPGYTENPNSSLISMVNYFIKCTGHDLSSFIEYDSQKIKSKIEEVRRASRKIFLFAVTFSLLEVCKAGLDLSGIIIIETGGMKGMGKELTREELHEILKDKLKATQIYSEYGMTELLSQAYTTNDLFFNSPPWMRVLVREVNDPFAIHTHGKGALNIIDLANVETCAFIETQDIGKVNLNSSFYVTGRTDHSDLRGCNLLYA